MKQNESMALYVLRLAGTLLLICLVTAGLLAGVNAVTEPIIDDLNAAALQQAINDVLPGQAAEITGWTDKTGLVHTVYQSENGYAVEVGPGGFDNTITMMVGIDNEGKVLGISIVSHTETAGLGAVADAETPAGINFREQFVGTSGSVSVEKDNGEIHAITGATITSRAICVGVNAALDCVAGLVK